MCKTLQTAERLKYNSSYHQSLTTNKDQIMHDSVGNM